MKADIEQAIINLGAAIIDAGQPGVAPDTETIAHSLQVLVGGALIDLNRIADAVEKLTTFNLQRVGELVVANFGDELTEGVNTVLSPEERDTIEALRRGDIVVNVVPGRDVHANAYSPTPVDDGPDWIVWNGDRPNPPDLQPYDVVEVMFSNGGENMTGPANTFAWTWMDNARNISGYRLIAKHAEPDPEPPTNRTPIASAPVNNTSQPRTLGDFG